MADTLLEVDGLAKSFAGVQALDGYALRLPPLAIHGVIGPNGAGKTTLFNLLTGFLLPTAGTIRFLSHDITRQPALAPYVAEEIIPGAQVESDADFEAAIRRNGISNLHPVGTCHMGTDEAAVCDPRLRVNGVRGLRVADAAIMPSVPAGNTNAPSIMIGEKAADMILEDARAA